MAGSYTVKAVGGTANSVTIGTPSIQVLPTLWLAVGGGATFFTAAARLTNHDIVVMKGEDNRNLILTTGGSPIVNRRIFKTEFGVAGAQHTIGAPFVNHGSVSWDTNDPSPENDTIRALTHNSHAIRAADRPNVGSPDHHGPARYPDDVLHTTPETGGELIESSCGRGPLREGSSGYERRWRP